MASVLLIGGQLTYDDGMLADRCLTRNLKSKKEPIPGCHHGEIKVIYLVE